MDLAVETSTKTSERHVAFSQQSMQWACCPAGGDKNQELFLLEIFSLDVAFGLVFSWEPAQFLSSCVSQRGAAADWAQSPPVMRVLLEKPASGV